MDRLAFSIKQPLNFRRQRGKCQSDLGFLFKRVLVSSGQVASQVYQLDHSVSVGIQPAEF